MYPFFSVLVYEGGHLIHTERDMHPAWVRDTVAMFRSNGMTCAVIEHGKSGDIIRDDLAG